MYFKNWFGIIVLTELEMYDAAYAVFALVCYEPFIYSIMVLLKLWVIMSW